jgi:carboxyl-terminal processing protease
VIRLGFLLMLFAFSRAQAQPLTAVGLDQERMAAVYAEALTFMEPRILDPVSIPQLTLWGLQGLTTLDPALRIGVRDSTLQLFRFEDIVLETPAPRDDTPLAWARAAALITAAGYPLSQPLRQAATQGIIQAFFDEMLGRLDPYSRYVAPLQAGEDRARRAGRAGIGVIVGLRGRLVDVLEVVRDSPASIAGIRPGDILFAIDGQRTQDQDPATIGALLSGPEGSAVTVTWRGHDGRVRNSQMIRVMVPPETVFAQRVSDMLVLRITSFSGTTASHLALSVQDAMSEPRPVHGIVLDLRDNRGGLLRQAVTAADTFLPAGIVAITKGRDPEASHIWRSAEGELAENVPLVILVDGRTASSAEILAAALADRGRAVVVGSSTVGKGLVQTIDPLPDGGDLFVTWSRVLAPLGWPLQGLGVLPQVCTSLGTDALNRQLADLSEGFQPMTAALRRARAARAPLPASEVLDIRAPCPGAEGRAADLSTARTLIANPAAYAAALLPPMVDR